MGIPPGRHGEHVAELVAFRRRREAAEAAIERVRALHYQPSDSALCAACPYPLPCPTIRALDAPPTTTDEGGD